MNNDSETQTLRLAFRLGAIVICLVIAVAGISVMYADHQRARMLEKNVAPAGVDCVFNTGASTVCIQLAQQAK